MDNNNNKKIITLVFVSFAIIAWLVAGIIFDVVSIASGAFARVMDQDLFRHGLPFAVAVLTFSLLQFNSKVAEYADGVVSEIKKVVWPGKPETSAMTIVVCIMLMISGVLLGVFDMVSGFIVNYLIKI